MNCFCGEAHDLEKFSNLITSRQQQQQRKQQEQEGRREPFK